jgi:phage host-nuclease inhibitor protein Gam
MDRPNLVRIGDELFDADTGEFAGSALQQWVPDVIETETDLLDFLRELQEAELKLQMEKARLNTIIENTKRMVRKAESKVEWMRAKWGEQAVVLSEELLPRKADGSLKTGTYVCPYGKITRRNVAPTVTVTDPDAAAQWLQHCAPEAIVRSTKILVSKVPSLIKEQGGIGLECKPGYVSTNITVVEKEKASEED